MCGSTGCAARVGGLASRVTRREEDLFYRML